MKWRGKSYWHCSWITELQLEIQHPEMYRAYSRKNDMEEAPMLSDGESSDDGEQQSPTKKSKGKEDDKLNLEARFFRFGVSPEWMQIFRILNHR